MLRKLQYCAFLVTLVYGSFYACGCCPLPKGCALFNGILVSLMEDLGG